MSRVIDLKKKVQITLEKKGIFNEKANVVLALDISVSMRPLFQNGIVQDVVERILAVGMNMDIDKKIDIYLFGKNAHRVGSVTADIIDGYVSKHLSKYSLESGTMYAGVMELITEDFIGSSKDKKETGNSLFGKLFGKNKKKEELNLDKEETKYPTVVFFITDGDNFDQYETENVIKQISDKPIFWQFVGIGKERFSFLKGLDDMKGRYVDNADFFQLNDIRSISDEELYDRILNELPSWLKEIRSKGII